MLTEFFRAHRESVFGVCVITVALTLIFVPVFFGRFAFEDDALQYNLPVYRFYSDALKNGEGYQVAPQVLSGFPLSLSYTGGLGEPLNWVIFKILPFIFGYAFRMFLNYLLSAVFVFLFTRQIGLSLIASLVSAFAFVTAQHFKVGFVLVHSNSFLILTGLFYVAARIFYHRGPWVSFHNLFSAVLGTAIFYVGMRGGAAQLNLESLVLLFFFVIFLSWRRYAESRSFKSLAAPYALLFIIFVVGTLLLMPYLMRVFEFVPSSIRGGGLTWAQVLEMSPSNFVYRLKSTLFLLFPDTFSIPGTLESNPGLRYIGTAALLFFLFSFFLKKPMLWYAFLGLFLFSFLSSFRYPLFWAMHALPLFAFFRSPGAWLFAGAFPMSVMAGFGYDAFVGLSTFGKREKAILGIMVFLVLVAAGYVHLNISTGSALTILNSPTGWDLLLPMFLWFGTFGWFVASVLDIRARGVRVWLVGVVIAGFLIPFWTVSFKKATSVDSYSILKKPPVYEEIEKREKESAPFRIFNFFGGDTQWFQFAKVFNPDAQQLADFQRDVTRPGNYPLLGKLESISGYHDNISTRRYEHAQFFFEKQSIFDVLQETPRASFLAIPERKIKILGMMNVKYLWSSVPLVEGLLNKVSLVSVSMTGPHRVPIFLYRNKEFLPRVLSPASIVFLEEDDANFSEIFEKDHDFRSTGFIECRGCSGRGMREQVSPEITLRKIGNGLIVFSTKGMQEAWVIVSHSHFPGWQAYVDGKKISISPANYIYQGILVSAGEHTVVIRYE